jgi:hypothetical protein
MKRNPLLNFLVLTLLCVFLSGCKTIAYKNYSKVFVRVEEFSEKKFSTYFTWNEIDQNKYSREEVFFYSGANKLQEWARSVGRDWLFFCNFLIRQNNKNSI